MLCELDESLGRQPQPPTQIFERIEMLPEPAPQEKPKKKGLLAKWIKIPKRLPFMKKGEAKNYKTEQFMIQTRYITFYEG